MTANKPHGPWPISGNCYSCLSPNSEHCGFIPNLYLCQAIHKCNQQYQPTVHLHTLPLRCHYEHRPWVPRGTTVQTDMAYSATLVSIMSGTHTSLLPVQQYMCMDNWGWVTLCPNIGLSNTTNWQAALWTGPLESSQPIYKCSVSNEGHACF